MMHERDGRVERECVCSVKRGDILGVAVLGVGYS